MSTTPQYEALFRRNGSGVRTVDFGPPCQRGACRAAAWTRVDTSSIYDYRRNNPDHADWREAKDIFEFLMRERVFAPFSDSPRVYRRCQWQLPLTGWVVVVDDVIDIH